MITRERIKQLQDTYKHLDEKVGGAYTGVAISELRELLEMADGLLILHRIVELRKQSDE